MTTACSECFRLRIVFSVCSDPEKRAEFAKLLAEHQSRAHEMPAAGLFVGKIVEVRNP